jgi:hypothetical protein
MVASLALPIVENVVPSHGMLMQLEQLILQKRCYSKFETSLEDLTLEIVHGNGDAAVQLEPVQKFCEFFPFVNLRSLVMSFKEKHSIVFPAISLLEQLPNLEKQNAPWSTTHNTRSFETYNCADFVRRKRSKRLSRWTSSFHYSTISPTWKDLN